MEKEQYKLILPENLYREIEAIYNSFLDIQREASGMLSHHSQLPNATAHLKDVLSETENATNTIIDSVTNIQIISDNDNVPQEIKQQIAELITKVYEACAFQDITGQRIKKVVNNFDMLENKLAKILQIAKVYAGNKGVYDSQAGEKSLMNGPQLNNDVPSQNEVDKLFANN